MESSRRLGSCERKRVWTVSDVVHLTEGERGEKSHLRLSRINYLDLYKQTQTNGWVRTPQGTVRMSKDDVWPPCAESTFNGLMRWPRDQTTCHVGRATGGKMAPTWHFSALNWAWQRIGVEQLESSVGCTQTFCLVLQLALCNPHQCKNTHILWPRRKWKNKGELTERERQTRTRSGWRIPINWSCWCRCGSVD